MMDALPLSSVHPHIRISHVGAAHDVDGYSARALLNSGSNSCRSLYLGMDAIDRVLIGLADGCILDEISQIGVAL